jgi:hypothetical protein
MEVAKHNIYIPGTYNPPIGHYTQTTLPEHINPAVFIGKDGCYFKKTSERSGATYIWYNDQSRVIEIWGSESSVSLAKNILEKRYEKFSVD